VKDGSLGSMKRWNTDGSGSNVRRNIGKGIRDKLKSEDWKIVVGDINTFFPKEYGGESKVKLDVFKHLLTSSDSDVVLLSEQTDS